jgi:hypothetical protein
VYEAATSLDTKERRESAERAQRERNRADGWTNIERDRKSKLWWILFLQHLSLLFSLILSYSLWLLASSSIKGYNPPNRCEIPRFSSDFLPPSLLTSFAERRKTLFYASTTRLERERERERDSTVHVRRDEQMRGRGGEGGSYWQYIYPTFEIIHSAPPWPPEMNETKFGPQGLWLVCVFIYSLYARKLCAPCFEWTDDEIHIRCIPILYRINITLPRISYSPKLIHLIVLARARACV